MTNEPGKINLSVVLTVVGGRVAVRKCLQSLAGQIDFEKNEIIVPYDKWSKAVGDLAAEFPRVFFHFINDPGKAASENVASHTHRLFDRRRAAGLRLAKGKIIAMTEDYARPAPDWCRRILETHARSDIAVIGGAIENGVDKPLNWAWYYCDFGRYGRPLTKDEAQYVSDVNVSYKREALDAVRDVWLENYQETSVHWALQERGTKLFLNDEIVVFQHRPPLSLTAAWRERVEWGRIFAETRTKKINARRRLHFAAGTIFLPFLLTARAVGNVRRQKKSLIKMAKAYPLMVFLLAGWSLGEFFGYVAGEPAGETLNSLSYEDSGISGK